MIEPFSAIRSLSELQSRFASIDKAARLIAGLETAQTIFTPNTAPTEMDSNMDGSMSSESNPSNSTCSMDYTVPESNGEPINAKVIDYRGESVACFELNGIDMICLPQVYELFLKTLVGGLHTVYTKLKRLEIIPIVCNVEQVRSLRSLGAIQPGVNRCKLIATADFDRLFEDCTSTSRPGRPPKRMITMEEWNNGKQTKYDGEHGFPSETSDYSIVSQNGVGSPSMFLGQFLPSFTAHQLLMQQMMAVAAAQKDAQHIRGDATSLWIQNKDVPTAFQMREDEIEEELSMTAAQVTTSDSTTPLNLTKSNQNSETSDNDSLENMRKEESSVSPNQSVSDRGGSSGSAGSSGMGSSVLPGSSDASSSVHSSLHHKSQSSDQSSLVLSKVLALVDVANEHFKQQRDQMRKERGNSSDLQTYIEDIPRILQKEMECLRGKLRAIECTEEGMRDELEKERKKSRTYFRRFCSAKKEALNLRQQLLISTTKEKKNSAQQNILTPEDSNSTQDSNNESSD